MPDNYNSYQNPPPGNPSGGGYQNSRPGLLYAANSPKNKAAPPKKLKRPVDGEVTLIAEFVWKPVIPVKLESHYYAIGKWSPSRADTEGVTGVTAELVPQNFIALLAIINKYEPKSIKRLNFWTHSDEDAIAMKGYLVNEVKDKDGKIIDHQVIFESFLSEEVIEKHNDNHYLYNKESDPFTIEDVRGKFADKAIVVLYGCKSGYSPNSPILTGLNKLLRVDVVGFKYKINFCNTTIRDGSDYIDRKAGKVGIYKPDFKCDVDTTKDWRSLISDRNNINIYSKYTGIQGDISD